MNYLNETHSYAIRKINRITCCQYSTQPHVTWILHSSTSPEIQTVVHYLKSTQFHNTQNMHCHLLPEIHIVANYVNPVSGYLKSLYLKPTQSVSTLIQWRITWNPHSNELPETHSHTICKINRVKGCQYSTQTNITWISHSCSLP